MWASVVAFGLVCGLHETLGAQSRFGLLVAVTEGAPDQLFCIRYFPELNNLSSTADEAPKYSLKDLRDLSEVDTCDEDASGLGDLTGQFGLVSAGKNGTGNNCSVAERANVIETHKALGLIADDSVSTRFNASEYTTNILVTALFKPESKQKLLDIKKTSPNAKFIIYGPEEAERTVDGSIILIFCMAVFTVGLGSLWSGYTKYYLHVKREQRLSSIPSSDQRGNQGGEGEGQQGGVAGEGGVPDPQAANADQNEPVSVHITPLWVCFFVVAMCTMLLMLYFFFNQLVYIIIGMFVLASIIATYACFEPLVMWSYEAFPSCPPILKIPRLNLYLCVVNMELRQFVLLAFSVSLSVIWVVYRNADWAWILQDILGILFSLNMLKTLRLPSFKICTILLSILFFYDIFFVFITPLFTKNGKSVMVEVATGADTGEQLPMVLRVPRLTADPLHACWVPYSLLGFGDILVPGMLVSYCHGFDLMKGTPCKIYWVVANIFYALSLITTFISLFLMESAQPALLYIVPLTLVPMSLLAFARGEMKDFWEGDALLAERDGQILANENEVEETEKSPRRRSSSDDPAIAEDGSGNPDVAAAGNSADAVSADK